jgi:hypothetical protein
MWNRKRLLAAATITAAISATGTATAAAAVPTATTPANSHDAAAPGCGGNLPATPRKWTYGNSSCGVIGYPGSRVTYRWWITGGRSDAVLQAYAFDARGHAQWVSCGWGGGGCTVSWGNYVATPKVRAWNANGVSYIRFTTR